MRGLIQQKMFFSIIHLFQNITHNIYNTAFFHRSHSFSYLLYIFNRKSMVVEHIRMMVVVVAVEEEVREYMLGQVLGRSSYNDVSKLGVVVELVELGNLVVLVDLGGLAYLDLLDLLVVLVVLLVQEFLVLLVVPLVLLVQVVRALEVVVVVVVVEEVVVVEVVVVHIQPRLPQLPRPVHLE